MSPISKTNWTSVDEERFQDMARLRDEIMAKNRMPVIDLVSDMLSGGTKSAEGYVEFFEKNAERIRDVLDPYDSGERPPQAVNVAKKNFGDL